MTKLNPKKMKVAELKAELEARNIQVSKGLKKADLVAMLASAMESENDGGEDTALMSEDGDASGLNESDVGTAEDDSVLLADDEPAESEQKTEETNQPDVPQEATEDTGSEQVSEEPLQATEQNNILEPSAAEEPAEAEEEEASIPLTGEPPLEEEEPMQTDEAPGDPQQATEPDSVEENDTKDVVSEQAVEQEEDVAKPDESSENADEGFGSAPVEATETDPDSQDNSEDQSKQETELKDESKVDANGSPHSEKRERSSGTGRSSESEQPSRKRRHEDHHHDRHRRYEERYAPPPEEPEEEFDDTLVVLDKYNSDLNMKLHRDRLTGQPLTLEGFAYLWAGARATYGVKTGKVCYECKLSEEHSVRHLPSNEPNRHLVRLGWSTNTSSKLLGEEELSYAYCATAKAVTNKTATDYGETFKEGDVIGCYLDLTGDENVTMSFTKNGNSLGVAFTVEKEKLNDVALFPHVLCKNTTVEMNFGQKEEPFFSHPAELDGYVFLSTLPLEERVRGTLGPTARKDCEVLMLCGLPGAGKTYYADKLAEENREKNYSILGTNAIMKGMKVTGIENKSSRDMLINNATNCLNRLSQVACRKKRNFILDQTNVYSSAQRRRMRTFEGFQRKAIVIVPSDEDFKSRVEKRTKDEGKDIPDIAVYEMKANFTLPEVGDLFDEVTFAELDKEEASKIIEKYREEARKKGPPPEKRFRGGFDMNRHGGRGGWGAFDNRMGGARLPFRGGMGGGFGGGNFNRFGNQRGGGGGFRDGGRGDNRRGGRWNDKGSGGNWQQNRNYGGGRGGSGNQGSNRGGYGGNRTGGYNNNNRFSGNQNRSNQNRNFNNQQNRSNSFNNRNQGRGGQRGSGGGTSRPAGTVNYHQAYQQQAAQFSSHNSSSNANQQAQSGNNQSYQQSYNPQSQQPDYSQQWAQYYQQQQAAAQQQQQVAAAAAAAQYQNYYASYQQQSYSGQATRPQ